MSMGLQNFAGVINEAAKRGRKRAILPGNGGDSWDIVARAVREGLVFPIWIGNGKEGARQFERYGIGSAEREIIDEEPARIMDTALAHLNGGEADILMQGAVPHRDFLDRVLDPYKGLRAGKTASFVVVFDPPLLPRLTMLTDAYINNFPSLEEKVGIVANAIRLAGVLGIVYPKIAALSALEQVNPAIPSSLDAAILSKMAERRQFGAAILEGPLDIDCALSEGAAVRKGVQTMVSGQTDIYVTPNVESGYLTVQVFAFIARTPVAGVLMGTSHPVVLDLAWIPEEDKLVEIALAVLLSNG